MFLSRALLGLSLIAAMPNAFASDALADGFKNVPQESRMRMYWRIFGPAWSNDEIDYQLGLLKDVGLKGVIAYFMYPFQLDDPAKGIINQRFGSPEFLDTFGHAVAESKRKGLSFGVNGSTGWPFGGATVTPKDAAQKIYAKVVKAGKTYDLKEGEKLLAAYQFGSEVTKSLRPGPYVADTTLYITGPAGMRVKRPSYGAEGLALNHYDKGALSRYLKDVIEPMVKLGAQSVGCDSLEVYNANWTSDMPAQFLRRRGYALEPHLPELFRGPGPVRFDFWRTLTELMEERFTKPLGGWCASKGIPLEMEAYGTPPNPMTCYRYIQIPVGEHYEWKGFSVQKYVASGANLCGRTVVSSEAWTWAGLPNRLIDSLSDLKLCSDMSFLSGTNDLVAVDYPYSPRAAGSPGWLPYYGPAMNQNNPQWTFFPALVQYVNRCQWMLQQGRPVRKVAVYLPVEDSLANGPVEQMLLDFEIRDRLVTGKTTSEFGLANGLKHHSDLVFGLISSGLDYDGIDFWAMNLLAKVGNGKLSAGFGRYEAVVLPNLSSMDLPALQRVAEFARGGGLVVASRGLPSAAAGLKGSSSSVQELIVELFGSRRVAGKVRSVGLGHAIWVAEDKEVAPAVAQFVRPELTLSPTQESVGFVHRRTKDRDIYFLSNVGPTSVHFTVSFPGKKRATELWDALAGTSVSCGVVDSVDVVLQSRGSVFVVRGGHASAPTRPVAAGDFRLGIVGPWSVRFEGPDAPTPVVLDRLCSWTSLPGGKHFSGLGVYTTAFTVEGELPRSAVLSLGGVREAAVVKLNGKSLGTLIVAPFEVEVGSALRVGKNELEITVGNLLVNRFLGQPDMDMAALRAKYGNRFQAPEEKELMKEPAPSGLLGPVRLSLQR